MSAAAKFYQADIERACKGAIKAGLTVRGVEIDPNGRILIRCDEIPSEEASEREWDEAAKKDAHVA